MNEPCQVCGLKPGEGVQWKFRAGAGRYLCSTDHAIEFLLDRVSGLEERES